MAAAGRFRRQAGCVLDGHGVSASQYNILRILRGAGGELPIMTIRDRMVDRQPSITRLVDRLDAKGLVRRTPSQETDAGSTVRSRLRGPHCSKSLMVPSTKRIGASWVASRRPNSRRSMASSIGSRRKCKAPFSNTDSHASDWPAYKRRYAMNVLFGVPASLTKWMQIPLRLILGSGQGRISQRELGDRSECRDPLAGRLSSSSLNRSREIR